VGQSDDRWQLLADVGGLVSRYRLDDPANELGFARVIENRGARHNERLRLTWRPMRRLALTLGGSHERSRLQIDSDGSAATRSSRLRLRPALSALAEPIDGLHVSGVAAIARHDTVEGGTEREVLAPAARLGVRYRVIDQLAVFANGGHYARVPLLGELFGVAAGVLGNPDLAAERGWSADAGASVELAAASVAGYAQVVGFVRDTDELIAYRRSSLGVVRPYNVAEARILGLEAVLGLTAWRVLAVSTALTALDPRDTSEERAPEADLIPLQARLVVTPRVEFRSPPWRTIALDRATLGATLAYRSSRVADPAGLIVLDEQARLDVDVRLAFAERFTLAVRMHNVLDAPIYDVVGYPLPGRAVFSELEVTL
jgi:iron complex outermembrane receptor protein